MKPLKVAVLNTSREIMDLLIEVLRAKGFKTCDTFTKYLKDGKVEFDKYVRLNKPDVILYDIAIPYEENYMLFKSLAKSKVVKNIPFVLTTTNKKVLDSLVGKTGAFEIIGKPYDLEELVRIIQSIKGEAVRDGVVL